MSTLTLESIQKKMSIGDAQEYIGSTVFWELQDAETDYDTLKSLLESNGLDAREAKDGGLMPNRVTPCSAWKRSIAAFKKSDYVKANKLVIDSEDIPADKDIGQTPKGLLTVHTKQVDSSAGHVGFSQQWALEFDKQVDNQIDPSVAITRKYTPADPNAHDDFYEAVKGYYRDALNRVNLNDVRETIKRVLASAKAFSMRKHGGVYFVPEEFQSVVDTLEEIVKHIGGSSLGVIKLPKASERTVQTFKQTLVDALENELTALEKTINVRLESIKKNKSGEISSTYKAVLEEMSDFNARADYYSEVLKAKYGELQQKYTALNKRLEDRVASLS